MPRVGGAAAVAAAGQALAREPRCGPALAVRGFVRATIERDTDAGLADLDASVRVDPGYWVSRGLRGWALVSVGRVEEAVREVRRGIELNPWAHWYSGLLAQYQLFAGDRKSAIRTARDAVARFPDIDYAYFAASQVASALDLHDEAIAFGVQAMRLAPDTPLLHTALATALARAGRRQESLALARSIERAPEPLPAVWLAACWLALGRRDRAVEWLRLARDQGAPQYAYAAYDPQLCALEDGPRDAVHRPGPVASRA
jgi:tetratricopeptide (TPR) repeat protein